MRQIALAISLFVALALPATASVVLDDASSEYLDLVSTLGLTPPFSVSCWAKFDDDTIDQAIWSLGDTGSINNYFGLVFQGSSTERALQLTRDSTTSNFNQGSNSTVNAWHHYVAIWISTTDRDVILDGGTPTTNTTSVTPAGLDTIAIGVLRRSSNTQFASGKIAYCAVYSDELTSGEITSLAGGACPANVNTANLVEHWPLLSNPNGDKGNNLTENGAGITYDGADNPSVSCGTLRRISPIIFQ